MTWEVVTHDDFDLEFDALDEAVREALLARLKVLEEFGYELGRPHVDTLEGSKHANMKELRFKAADGVWRAAFAFDPQRQAVVLVAGDKSGVSQDRFYKALIAKADKRYDEWLALKTKKGA